MNLPENTIIEKSMPTEAEAEISNLNIIEIRDLLDKAIYYYGEKNMVLSSKFYKKAVAKSMKLEGEESDIEDLKIGINNLKFILSRD